MTDRKKLGQFFIKCILAATPFILLVLFILLCPFAYMDEEYPSWAYSKNFAQGKEKLYDAEDTALGEDPKIVILGDSRAMADVVPSVMCEGDEDISAVNLGIGGATSIEMYYTLKDYLDTHETPEKIYIMFAPFHYSLIDNFWQRTAYFNYLSIADECELLGAARDAESETLNCDGAYSDLLSYRCRLVHKYLPALINSRFVTRYSPNSEKYDEYVSTSGHGLFGTLDGCSDLNYEVNYDEMHKTGDAALIQIYFDRLLALCTETRAGITVLQPPMNESSYVRLKDTYVDEYKAYLGDLAEKYGNITIETEIPCYEDEYFGDSSHLNMKGALKYTEGLNMQKD